MVLATLLAALSPGCISDAVTTDASSQPEFSVDTLSLGLTITDQKSPTHSMRVYNRHDKSIKISSIRLASGNESPFRLNVDGMSGREFHEVEIRAKDSIYVFVDATLPPNGIAGPATINDQITFTTNGIDKRITLTAEAYDVERIRAEIIDCDTRWTGDMPKQIFDSLIVARGATLTLDAGCRLMFHDKAYMAVYGTLIANGSVQQPIVMSGDRTGNVVASIPFDIMSGQWAGVRFERESKENSLSHTVIANTLNGVKANEAQLTIYNCRLRNSDTYPLAASRSRITAVGCEIADGANGALLLKGGQYDFNHCTLANYFIFAPITGALVQITELTDTEAYFTNSIVYGIGNDLSPTDISGSNIIFRRSLLKSEWKDDDNFIDMLWGKDPMYMLDREKYIFDYRLLDDSPALNAADASLDNQFDMPTMDFYGNPRKSAGAYQ